MIEFKFKNPEYLINGEIGDRKGVHSERGIAVEVRSDMRTREEIAMVLEKLKAER